MVLALSCVLLACGDEDKDKSFAKKDAGRDDGGSRTSTGGKPGAGGGDPEDGDAGEPDPDEPDADEPDDLDASTDDPDAEPSAAADASPGPAGGKDGGADAGPAGPDGSTGGQCAEPGESCETLDCCADAICILQPETGDPICAAECSAPQECNSNCCISVRDANAGACVPADYCEAPPTGDDCDDLELVAEDGTFLGEAVSSPVAIDGVCNKNSPHGSSVGLASIYNEVGAYGSEVGLQSAYNPLTSTPPALVCIDTNEIVAFVTKNQLLTGGELVDPDALCAALANAGL